MAIGLVSHDIRQPYLYGELKNGLTPHDMKNHLQAAGFKVSEAGGGEDGIKKTIELVPDLVLLDIEMPGMNGIQTIGKLKAEPNLEHLKIVFLTNHGEPTDKDAWLDKKFSNEIGASGYIRKTDDLDKIVEQVKTIFES